MKKKDVCWVMIRDGEVSNIFNSRREAITYFKKILLQTLNDFDKQDKTDEYDYQIRIPKIEIKPVINRDSFLGL